MDEVRFSLIVLGLLFLLGALLTAGLILRRYLLTRGVGTFDCWLRRDAGPGIGRWMVGVARYEPDRLEWFRLFAVSPRPWRSLDRGRLVVLERRAPHGPELRIVSPATLVVRCSYGSREQELAMSESAYNGFATWLESAPPGQPRHTS